MSEIIEIKHKKENDENIYELFIDGKLASTARILAYSKLLNICSKEKRKGFGTRLLQHIEEIAKQNSISEMTTSDIDSRDIPAVNFFKKMGYTLYPLSGDEEFLEGHKKLQLNAH